MQKDRFGGLFFGQKKEITYIISFLQVLFWPVLLS